MTINKRHILRFLWAVQMGCFAYFYVFGAYGLVVLKKLRVENQAYQAELDNTRLGIAGLQQEVKRWQHDDFLREKIAREELQMIGADEQVYYVTV